MSTLLNSLEVAVKAQNGITGRDFRQNIGLPAGAGRNRAEQTSVLHLNQPGLN
jgi:hypothetical protein